MPASYSWDTFNLRFPWSDWPHLFLIVATPKFFDKILIYVNLYQYAKNQAVSISFGDMVDQKILQSDWLRTFCPISQEHKFSQIWDLCRNTGNNMNFHYRSNSVKINDQIFEEIEKNMFLAHFLGLFSQFWGKTKFLPKSNSVTHNFIWVSSTMPNFRKNLWYNFRKMRTDPII